VSPSQYDPNAGQRNPDLLSRDSQLALKRELVELRNEQGASIPRIQTHCPVLVGLGATFRECLGPDLADDVMAARELLRQAITDLHDRERDLLLAQFAFSFRQSSRKQRELEHLKDIRRRGGAGSESSFERWATDGIEQVVQRIIAKALGATPNPPEEERARAGLRSDSLGAASRGSYLAIQRADEFLRIDANRVLRDRLCIVYGIALQDGAHSRLVSYKYYSDQREGVVEIIPEFGCEAIGEPIYQSGVTQRWLRMVRFLRAGDDHVFAYRVIYHTDAPVDPPFVYSAPPQDRLSEAVSVQFHSDCVPVAAWAFDGVSAYDVLTESFRKQESIQQADLKVISRTFTNPNAGLCCGLTWDWD
jgi:hypothetical protein